VARNRIRKVGIVPVPSISRADQDILDRLKRLEEAALKKREAEAAKKRKEQERRKKLNPRGEKERKEFIRKKSDGGKAAGEGTIRRIKPSDVGRRAQFIKV
jgi:septal ring factor EnvC (AmiA/AmiB activator)